MDVSDDLSIPAYLLIPAEGKEPTKAVVAIHGHGDIEPCIGQRRNDYHRQFALELAGPAGTSSCARRSAASACSTTWPRIGRGIASTTGTRPGASTTGNSPW